MSRARLLALAREHYRPVMGDDGRPYVVPTSGPALACPVSGTGPVGLRSRLAGLHYDAFGWAAPGRALSSAVATLACEAEATEPVAVAYRVARADAGVVVDLGRPDGRCVVVGPEGWRVVDTAPTLFRRTALTGELPLPVPGGGLDELRQLVNVDDAPAWRLVLAWLVAALLADVDHPVLAVVGGPCAGKSTAARALVSLVDPSPAPLRRPPRDLRSWAVTAGASWVVALDDVSPVSPWLAGVLARTVDGAGIVHRAALDDVAILALRRAVLVTSRDLGPVGADLGGRLVAVRLADVPACRRRPEARLWAAYEQLRPRLLGALLDLTARVLDALDPRPDLDPAASRSRSPARPRGLRSSGLEGSPDDLDTPRERDSAPEPLAASGDDFARILAAVDQLVTGAR